MMDTAIHSMGSEAEPPQQRVEDRDLALEDLVVRLGRRSMSGV